ncbi:glycosyltransferase family protein [Flavobacterium limi]|uniref:Glycosyl transferase family 1 n=1 Tax=Flavobacterium limi TaxID=2045105 RepID=A0ABQ1UUS9_9FLAO|nr:glycosyltransferase [Flavobacterium limi]GGF25621.1 glycosyl transferase family 1 [Flavobacterium limi]
MKILLVGEYSNLHATLAQGLRALGHDVTVASDGSKWMENEKDINLSRPGYDFYNSVKYLGKIHHTFRKFKGYDVVQINSPTFLDLKIKRNLNFYRFLLKNNAKVFLGAFGTDYFWEKLCLENKVLRYSDLFIGDKPLDIYKCEWLKTPFFKEANIEMAETCNGIVSCLYEYYEAYEAYYKDKLAYIPLPINTDVLEYKQKGTGQDKIKFFIGIQKPKTKLKGTDVMLEELLKIQQAYPNKVQVNNVTSIPWSKYVKIMSESDVLLDQLYSYTPGMNGLIGMSQGLVLVGGGEPEMYDLLNESNNHPIVNVFPEKEDIYNKLESLVHNKKSIPEISANGRRFVEEHHNYIHVAQQYVDFWNSK